MTNKTKIRSEQCFNVRELMQYTEEEIWKLPPGKIQLMFEDGESLVTTRNRTILSHYFWRLHRDFPGAKILKSHHVGNKQFAKGVELKIGATVFWDVYYAAKDNYPNLVWDMSKAIYEIINSIHNMTVKKLGAYVDTVDFHDIFQLINHEGIKRLKQEARDNAEKVGHAQNHLVQYSHEESMKIIRGDDPELRTNGICRLARANLFKGNQLVQFLISRGYVRSTSGHLYNEPIYTSFAEGMSTLYDALTESQSGTIALLNNKKPLQDSEYFNRQMQLLTEVIRCVEEGNHLEISTEDCGSPHTLEWLVEKEDLPGLDGKYYVDPKEGLKMFGPADHDKVGKVLQFRTITQCMNHDTSTVCRTCLGFISTVLPPKTNLGHFLTIEPLAVLSQLILGTKHEITSRPASCLELKGNYARWFKYHPENKFQILMRRSNAANNFRIRVPLNEIHGLNSLKYTTDPGALDTHRISCVRSIQLANADAEGNAKGDWDTFDLTVANAGSALSGAVLRELKRNKFTVKDDVVEFALMDFKDKDLFTTPRRSEDSSDFVRRLRHFVFGREQARDKGECISACHTVGQAVSSLKRIFDEKLHNATALVHAEIFVKACMARDPYNNDYMMPQGGEPFRFVTARKAIEMRCVPAALGYQFQNAFLLRPSTYVTPKRHLHTLDAMFTLRDPEPQV